MRARVDLHFHLLPGADDGPATMEETLELARAAVADGSGAVVATPHVRPDFITDVRDLPDRVREVRQHIARERVPLRVLHGAELGHDMVGRLAQADLETVAVGPPGARWLLVETPFEGIGAAFHDATEELHDRGFGVVLAHPERSASLIAGDHSGLAIELRRGAALQLNATSITGAHGAGAQRAALALLRGGLATAVSSDAHSRVRGPALEAGIRAAVHHGVPESVVRRPTDFRPVRLVSRGIVPAPSRAPGRLGLAAV